MNKFESKTGFIKRISTEEIFKNNCLYLGIYDTADDYQDCSEEEYNDYIKLLEKQEELVD
jgi:hypothetical protein